MRHLLTIALLCIATLVASGQKSIEELNREIAQAQAEIDRNTRLLNSTTSNRKSNERELALLQNNIATQRRMLRALENQIGAMTSDLSYTQRKIIRLEGDLEQLKSEYAQMIRESHRNYLLNNYMAFLFSSRDFDDATRRIDYMRRYNALREVKAHDIDSTTALLREYAVDLDTKRTRLDQTKTSRNSTLSSLGQDEKRYETTLATLRRNERAYNQQITTNRNRMAAAQKEIERIIAEEARRAEAARRNQSSAQQRATDALTGRFDQNRGRLPFPVRGGTIIDHYGVHAHPTQRGLTIDNKGVNIAGTQGARVYCVFEGVVARIFFFQGLNNSVMVRHGNYITVYSNLAAVSVKTGDRVILNQVLGTLSTSADSEDYMLHFEIWNETTNLNPEQWLAR